MLDYSYIAIQLTDDIASDLVSILGEMGVPPISKHNFHVTMMWDPRKTEIKEPLTTLDPKRIWNAHVVSIDVLGDGLVFHLNSKELMEEHRRLIDAGHQHSFPDFLPHMTVAYDLDDFVVLLVKQALAEWPGRVLTFTDEAFAPVKL